MIRTSLRVFVDRVLENGRLLANDVHQLQAVILPDGATTREEADVLIALDRAVPETDASWVVFLVASVVDFVVWTSRPTGYVAHDDAAWLIASLSCGKGPMRNAKRIAFEVIREAERVDEALLAFALRGSRTHEAQGGVERRPLAA